MFHDSNRKIPGKKRTVICFLTCSLLFHAAMLVFFADSGGLRERRSRVEVGLVSLPFGTAGDSGGESTAGPLPEAVAAPAKSEQVSGRTSAAPPGKKVERSVAAIPEETNLSPDRPRMESVPQSAAKSFLVPGQEQSPAENQPQSESEDSAGKGSEPLPSSVEAGPPSRSETDYSFEAGKVSAGAPLVEAMPRYDSNAPPPYPRLARERGWEGEVLLRVLVSENGAVRGVSVESSSGYAVLDAAAIRAVRSWRFHPSRLGSTPVEEEVLVPLRFKLTDF